MTENNEFSFASLMDFATLDTSDLKAQTSRLQKEGIYILEVKAAGFTEQPPADPADPMNYNLGFKSTVLVFLPQKDEDKANAEDMVGRDFNERYFLYGKEDLKGAIEQLMGRYKLVGLRHKGIMGGVEGSQPGWVDEIVGKRIAVRVRHYTNKNDQTNAAYDWLTPKAMAKNELEWEMLARDFLDENGEPVDLAA